MEFFIPELLLLIPLAFAAGLIDSAVGGGGLIQIPGLFTILPRTEPATLLGSNKLISMMGTSLACQQYAKKVNLHWRLLLYICIPAFIASYFGAEFVKHLPIKWLRPIMLALLLLMISYTFFKKDLGQSHTPRKINIILYGSTLGVAIGLYDGFFGPGTGSLLAFAFVRLFGYDFLNATAHSKIVNLSTNIGALTLFIPHGNILWMMGFILGASNMLGAFIGTRAVTKHGAPLIRKIFIFILSATIIKFGYDTFLIITQN